MWTCFNTLNTPWSNLFAILSDPVLYVSANKFGECFLRFSKKFLIMFSLPFYRHSIPVSGQTSSIIDMDPTGRYLAVGGSDSNVTLWDLNGIFPVQEITRQKTSIRRVSFSHDGRFIATLSEDCVIDVALVETGEKDLGLSEWRARRAGIHPHHRAGLPPHPAPPGAPLTTASATTKTFRTYEYSDFPPFPISWREKRKMPMNRGEDRRNERKPASTKEDSKDGGTPAGQKPRFESKFSFLRPTAQQLAGLEERKVAQVARDTKAASLAASRAAAAAAKLPVRAMSSY